MTTRLIRLTLAGFLTGPAVAQEPALDPAASDDTALRDRAEANGCIGLSDEIGMISTPGAGPSPAAWTMRSTALRVSFLEAQAMGL